MIPDAPIVVKHTGPQCGSTGEQAAGEQGKPLDIQGATAQIQRVAGGRDQAGFADVQETGVLNIGGVYENLRRRAAFLGQQDFNAVGEGGQCATVYLAGVLIGEARRRPFGRILAGGRRKIEIESEVAIHDVPVRVGTDIPEIERPGRNPINQKVEQTQVYKVGGVNHRSREDGSAVGVTGGWLATGRETGQRKAEATGKNQSFHSGLAFSNGSNKRFMATDQSPGQNYAR